MTFTDSISDKKSGFSGIVLSFINVPTSVWDNGDFWKTLAEEDGIKLQQNTVTGLARIINEKKIRVAWGDVKAMEKTYEKLSRPWINCEKGDILAIQRAGGVYSHYAVYIGNVQVIHYAAKNGDFGAEASIHKASFREFLRNDTSFEILSFSADGSAPKHTRINLAGAALIGTYYPNSGSMPEFDKYIRNLKGYHIYSPEETVARAESRVGETKYNLAFNNCEHFALWCKTGIHESIQVEDALKYLLFGGLQAINLSQKNNFNLTDNVQGNC